MYENNLFLSCVVSASLFFLGGIPGAIANSIVLSSIGAKRTLFLLILPLAGASWATMLASDGLWLKLVARVLSGLSYGFLLPTIKTYNSEVSHARLRGVTGAFYSVFLGLAMLYAFVVGYFVKDFQLFSYILAAPLLLFVVLCALIPESPFWLVERGEVERAAASLEWLRGKDLAKEELAEIVDKKEKKEAANDGEGESLTGKMVSGRFLKPLLKVGVIIVLLEMSAVMALSQYQIFLFEESGSSVDPYVASIALNLGKLPTSLISMALMRYCRRRPLFNACCLSVIAGHFMLAAFTYFGDDIIDGYGWVPIVALCLVQIPTGLGLVSIVYFTLEVRI